MYKKTIFQNGLRLITIPNKSTKAATVFVLFGVGSRYETPEINGVSHFIEHLMFKGTKKRPTTLDISKALDSVGAEYNAATAKDWTGYFVKIDSQKIELAIDVLSDMIYNSKFDSVEINKERGVIIEEINMYHDNPLMYIEDVLESLMFHGSTLGYEIAGQKKVIQKVTRRQIIDYKNRFYTPHNTVIGIAGNIDFKIFKLVKKYFPTEPDKKKIGEREKEQFEVFKFKQTKPQIEIRFKDTAQVQLALGFPGFSYFDEKLYPLYLLSVILGGNMSSRLFIAVRERRGLAYFVRAYPSIYQDTGSLVIQAGLDKSRLDEALKTIFHELKKVCARPVALDELKKAKDFLRGKVVLTLEDSSNLADWFVKQELLQNRVLTPEEKLKLFDRVTVEEIQMVAKEVLKSANVNLAIIGPYKDKKTFLKMIDL